MTYEYEPTPEMRQQVKEIVEHLHAQALAELKTLDQFPPIYIAITLLTANLLAVTTMAYGCDPDETIPSFCENLMSEYSQIIESMLLAAVEQQKQP